MNSLPAIRRPPQEVPELLLEPSQIEDRDNYVYHEVDWDGGQNRSHQGYLAHHEKGISSSKPLPYDQNPQVG